MTDNEIIKAWEYCTRYPSCPTDCPLYEQPMDCLLKLSKPTLDLIKRQQAEIESNKAKIKISAECIARQDKEIERLKSDIRACTKEVIRSHKIDRNKGIKEFAERLQERCYHQGGCLYASDIGAELNEMVGEG